MEEWRDAVALFLFVAGFIASCLTEFYCGVDSKHCPIDWSAAYGSNPADYNSGPGHCAKGAPDSGLGDPMLSVSSLLLAVPIVYLRWSGPLFTPLASAFLGIASFLFHANNSRITSILDFIGLNLLAPAILSDIVRWKGYGKVATLLFAALLTAVILVRLLIKDSYPVTNKRTTTFIYVAQPTITAITLVVAYLFGYIRQLWVGAVFIVAGSATLIAANNISDFWDCVNTQLIEPHFWGHVLVAVGATLFCRAVEHNRGYTKLRFLREGS
jgi:hypothetical protein